MSTYVLAERADSKGLRRGHIRKDPGFTPGSPILTDWDASPKTQWPVSGIVDDHPDPLGLQGELPEDAYHLVVERSVHVLPFRSGKLGQGYRRARPTAG